MPAISKKGVELPSSPIRKLVPFAEEAKRKGVKVYHLNIGQPDIETPEQVWNAIRNIDLKVLEYSHSAGFESYRNGLIKYYEKHNIHVDKDELIVTTGGSEALLFALMACFDPGDELIMPEPFYANYNSFSILSGVKVIPVSSSIDSGFALPPIEEFENLIGPKTKGIMICNPSNPTGYLYSKVELETLRSIVKKHNLFILSDEVYREFVYDDVEHFSCMNLEGLEEHVVLIDSVSKRYSMCGARIGVIISRNKEVMRAAMKMAQARLSPPTLAQIAAEAALESPDSYFIDVNREYQSRRNTLVEGLNKISGVICSIPRGAFYCMVQLPVENTDHFCEWILSDFELNGETLMMAPGSGFYASPGLGTKEVRLAYVLNEKELKNSLRILEAALKAYPKNTLKKKTIVEKSG